MQRNMHEPRRREGAAGDGSSGRWAAVPLADGVSLHGDGSIGVDCDRNPAADLATYADAPTPAEQSVMTAINFLKNTDAPKYTAIPGAQRSDQDNALLSILVILKVVLTP